MLLLNDDDEIDEHVNIIHNGDEENLGNTEEEGECQILDFLGLVDNIVISSQTLKLHTEIHRIPIQVLVVPPTILSLTHWFLHWVFLHASSLV